MAAYYDRRLARRLILDEFFDLTLYKRLTRYAAGDTLLLLERLIPVEAEHFEFWQEFFGMRLKSLDAPRRVKLAALTALARLFGERGIHLILGAIEIYGVQKYLRVWEVFRHGPLGTAVRHILNDEFGHENAIVSRVAARGIRPERIRDIFLGFHDGLVEMLGAVSGFFAAFATTTLVLIAGLTVMVAGSISMAAGAFTALSSEREIEDAAAKKTAFLEGEEPRPEEHAYPATSGAIVGVSYFFGALVPLLPVLLGARSLAVSVIVAAAMIVVVSYILAFLSGMEASRRIITNLLLVTVAVAVSYGIGTAARVLWGIGV
ncbi:MAG: VIT1/CCC1 transporter family protein [bacterium]|nr:VIT1/CCC1 transporter family protein [bacterium]MDZ4296560.1 VIT1/CCC1 transporter family protein [Patescibacteria group bacterium]